MKTRWLLGFILLALSSIALGERFTIDNDTGIITDHETGLEWLVGPDEHTDWYGANVWTHSLGDNWRMPTRSELQGLWDSGISTRNWGYFLTSGYGVWSDDFQDSDHAWAFRFDLGTEGMHDPHSSNRMARGFAVRVSATDETAITDRFVIDESGIIYDTELGLEWMVGPDEEMSWYEAMDWINNLSGGWRLPSPYLLSVLYNAGIKYDDWGPFEISGVAVWSSEFRDSSSIWGFHFSLGIQYWYPLDWTGGYTFAVRNSVSVEYE